MNNLLRFLIAAFMVLLLAACSDKEETVESVQNEAAVEVEVEVEVPASTPESKTEPKDTSVTAGMSEADVIAKLGEPSYTETRNLDALKITHSEWTTEAGTTSVQFHNDVVTFSQFVPAIN